MNSAEYITIAEFALRHNISEDVARQACRNGKYPGAYQDKSRRWHVLADTVPNSQGRPPKEEKRLPWKMLKATQNEQKEISSRARKAGLKVNEFIIRKALDR